MCALEYTPDKEEEFVEVCDEAPWLLGAEHRVRKFYERFILEAPKQETHCVYFLMVTASPSDRTPYGLYIGCTFKTPEERAAEHDSGHNAARVFRKHGRGVMMLPRLSKLVPRMSRADAERFEAEILASFRGESTNRPIRRLPPRRVFGG